MSNEFLGAVCLTSLYSPILTGTPEPQHAIHSSALRELPREGLF